MATRAGSVDVQNRVVAGLFAYVWNRPYGAITDPERKDLLVISLLAYIQFSVVSRLVMYLGTWQDVGW